MELLFLIILLAAIIFSFIILDKFSCQPIGGWAIFFEKLLQTIVICVIIGVFCYFLLLNSNKPYLSHYDNLPIFLGGYIACFLVVVVAIVIGIGIYLQRGKNDYYSRCDILD